jgi:hypothetical protein
MERGQKKGAGRPAPVLWMEKLCRLRVGWSWR